MRTKLPARDTAPGWWVVTAPGWWVVVYPEAREAAVYWRAARGPGSPSMSDYEGQTHRSEIDAARRAAAQIRRYAVGNGLALFQTMTFRRPSSAAEAAVELKRWRRRLRDLVFEGPFPYVLVPEISPAGRLHVHSVLPAAGLAATEVWTAGIADVEALANDDDRRRVASYLAKGFVHDHRAGQHRYEVGQGFSPARLSYTVHSRQAGRDLVQDLAGTEVRVFEPRTPIGVPTLLLTWNAT